MPELKTKLIDKIRQTDDEALLKELSNLMEMQEPEGVYMLDEKQKVAVTEARAQISSGEFLTEEEADKEITELLPK